MSGKVLVDRESRRLIYEDTKQPVHCKAEVEGHQRQFCSSMYSIARFYADQIAQHRFYLDRQCFPTADLVAPLKSLLNLAVFHEYGTLASGFREMWVDSLTSEFITNAIKIYNTADIGLNFKPEPKIK